MKENSSVLFSFMKNLAACYPADYATNTTGPNYTLIQNSPTSVIK